MGVAPAPLLYSSPQTYVQPTITQNILAPVVTETIAETVAPAPILYSEPQIYVQPTITENIVAPVVTETIAATELFTYGAPEPQEVMTYGAPEVITYAAPQEVLRVPIVKAFLVKTKKKKAGCC